MKRHRRRDDLEREFCFYCGAIVPRGSVGDHWPFPKRLGGTMTVPCCISCHSMKDRINIENWPTQWVIEDKDGKCSVIGKGKASKAIRHRPVEAPKPVEKAEPAPTA